MKIRGVRRRGRNGRAQPGESVEAGRSRARGSGVSPRVRARVTRLVVEVGNRADEWREAAVDANRAYGWWKSATRAERGDAAVVYLAAIDREEKAAEAYSRALETCSKTTPETAFSQL